MDETSILCSERSTLGDWLSALVTIGVEKVDESDDPVKEQSDLVATTTVSIVLSTRIALIDDAIASNEFATEVDNDTELESIGFATDVDKVVSVVLGEVK